MINDLARIFDRIGKKIGIHLGQKAHIHHEGKFLLIEVGGFFYGDTLPLQFLFIQFKLGQNNITFDKTTGRPENQMTFFKMLFPKQAFQIEGNLGMVPQ